MTNKSKWVETELERGDEVELVPLRSRLEARKNRMRTVIQRLVADQWVTVHKTAWTASPRADRIPESEMNRAAEEIADVLIDQIEAML